VSFSNVLITLDNSKPLKYKGSFIEESPAVVVGVFSNAASSSLAFAILESISVVFRFSVLAFSLFIPILS
jgi:hypothetical protein